jgi:hypothetical protein
MRKDSVAVDGSRRRHELQALARLAAFRSAHRPRARTDAHTAYTVIRLAMEGLFVPKREVVADRLADTLFALDEAVFVVDYDGPQDFRRFVEPLRRMYQEIDDMMRQITD